MRGKASVFGKIKQFLVRITDTVYRALARGPVGRFFAAYPVSDRMLRDSGTAALSRLGKTGHGSRPLRRGVAQAMDQSYLRKGAYRLVDSVCRCSLRSVGFFLLSMGAYVATISWLIASVWQGGIPDPARIFSGLALLVVGVMLTFSEQSLGYALCKGALLSWIMRELLGFSEDALKDVPRAGRREYAFAVPFGMVMGTAMAVLGPLQVLVATLALLLFFTVFVTPEAGVMLSVLFAPFVGLVPYGQLVLGLGIFTAAAGYFCKLLRGTRSFHMEILDLAVLALLLFTLLTGVFTPAAEGRVDALTAALVISFYFPAVNILATPHWLYRCRISLLVSATVASVVGIMQFIVNAVVTVQGGGVAKATELGRAVTAGFSSNTVFAYFMVLIFPLSLQAFLCARPKHRTAAGFVCVSILSATVLSFVQSAWLALLVELVVLCLICAKYAFPYLMLGLFALPGVIALLPASWKEALWVLFVRSGDLSPVRSGVAGEIAKRLFFENGEGFFGLGAGLSRLAFGLGSGGLAAVCALYTTLPVDEAQGSFSFWLYRLAEGGILGLLLPICLLFFLLQNSFSLLGAVRDKRGPIQPVVGVGLVAGVSVYACFQYTWGDPAVLLLFFLTVAFLAADARYRRLQQSAEQSLTNSGCFAEMEYQLGRKKEASAKAPKPQAAAAAQATPAPEEGQGSEQPQPQTALQDEGMMPQEERTQAQDDPKQEVNDEL